MSLGTIVVDERWRLPIVAVRLRAGRVEYHGQLDGPLDALPPERRQVVVLGEDGVVILRHRVTVSWPRVHADQALTYIQPIQAESGTPDHVGAW